MMNTLPLATSFPLKYDGLHPVPSFLNTGDDDMPTEISELSAMIGELRNFAAAQVATNAHMLDELKHISTKLGGFGEVSATFVEYRRTLHERFGKIHEQINDIDEELERREVRLRSLEDALASFRQQMKMITAGTAIACSLAASVLTTFGGQILKLLVHG